MLEIITHPNEILRQESEPVKKDELKTPEMQNFIDELIEAMKTHDGIGIAAPQTGVNKRIIVVNNKQDIRVIINPKIISQSARTIESEEGCLSVPGIFGIVERHKSVKVKGLDRNGEKMQIKASAPESVIYQHEIDHLDGILFIDKVIRYTTPPKL